MKFLTEELLNVLARALCAVVPKGFTGSVTVTINFHDGTPAAAKVGVPQEQYTKLHV